MSSKADPLAALRATLKRSVVDRAVQKYVDLHAQNHGRAPNRSAIETYRQLLDSDPRTSAEVEEMISAVAGLRRRARAFDFGEVLLVGAATGLFGSVLYEYRALVPAILVVLLVAAAGIHFRDVLRARLSWKRIVILALVCGVVAAAYVGRGEIARGAAAAFGRVLDVPSARAPATSQKDGQKSQGQ